MIHYSGPVNYQPDHKFTAISLSNILRMHVLHSTEDYLYVWKDSSGFVFEMDDIENAQEGANIMPYMVVALRDVGLGDFKQAHRLRIRKGFSAENVTTTWYTKYVDLVAPIVCDREHLQGGYLLWKSFIKKVQADSNYQMKVYDLSTNNILIDDVYESNVIESDLWSRHPDASKKNVVLILGNRGFQILH